MLTGLVYQSLNLIIQVQLISYIITHVRVFSRSKSKSKVKATKIVPIQRSRIKASNPQSKSAEISSISYRSKVEKDTGQSEIVAGQDFDRGRRSTYRAYLHDTPLFSTIPSY